jgi:GNAT superfamily N-acetyltransferase
MPELNFKILAGSEIQPYLQVLAELRITVFREYPYLYDGNPDSEARYLQVYAQAPDSLFVLAQDGERIVGASTAVPMNAENEAVKRPFLEHGYDPARLFYFGESVLLKPYRGQGAGVRFFQEREAYARRLGGFSHCCFCAVERPLGHPQRPPGHVPLTVFWNRRGYVKPPELHTTFSWKEIGESEESPKPMVFWLKALEAA